MTSRTTHQHHSGVLNDTVGWRTPSHRDRDRRAGTGSATEHSRSRSERRHVRLTGVPPDTPHTAPHHKARRDGRESDSGGGGSHAFHSPTLSPSVPQPGTSSQRHSQPDRTGTIQTLCPADKARVARLISELSTVTADKSHALSELAVTRQRFESELEALSRRQKEERERNFALQSRLAQSEAQVAAFRARLTALSGSEGGGADIRAESDRHSVVRDVASSTNRLDVDHADLAHLGDMSDVQSASGTAASVLDGGPRSDLGTMENDLSWSTIPKDVTIQGVRCVNVGLMSPWLQCY